MYNNVQTQIYGFSVFILRVWVCISTLVIIIIVQCIFICISVMYLHMVTSSPCRLDSRTVYLQFAVSEYMW